MRKRTKKEFVDYNDYQDRPFGLKWGTAFALAELTQVIDETQADDLKCVKEHPQMTRTDIDIVLQHAFLKSKIVSIQLNLRDDIGNLHDSIIGAFSGMADAEHVYIDEQPILWESIRNIQLI